MDRSVSVVTLEHELQFAHWSSTSEAESDSLRMKLVEKTIIH